MKRFFASVIILGCSGISAWAASVGFTLEHAAKMRHVLEVAVSPNGRQVAYTLSVPRDARKGDNGSAWRELHVVNQQGNSRPFITGDVSISSIAWSPNGQQITYLAKRGEAEQTALYGIPLNGGESQKILEHETAISSYHWSSTANRFLFLATEKAPENKAKDKGFNAEIYEEEPRRGQLWIAQQESPGDEWKSALVELDGAVFSARWAPDGERVAVGIADEPFIDFFYMYQRVQVVNVPSGDVTAEVKRQGKLDAFRWSPSGRHLAVIGGAHLNDPSPGRLFVANAVTGEAERVLKEFDPDFAGVEWLDEDTLLYIADDGCETAYGRFNVVTGVQESLDLRQAPVASAISVSSDATRVAYIGSTPRHGYEVYSQRLDRRRMKRLTDSNPWMQSIDLARQEVISYTARDGVRVDGVLVYPLDYQSGQRYPLILAVHGGPESRVANEWITSYSRPGQFAAAAGYFVFYPNYRGSTGRGLDYAMSHQADYAGKEFDDLVDAIDHFDRLGLVDPKKVGVTGGSYGGYASAWCATRYTDRFAASVMFVGISDLISKQGTTDIPDEMYLVHARKRPWDDWQFFLERSPIYYAEQARTPILILHGKDDPRVHPSQSLELYRTLKTIGKVPTRLVWYPGEGHGNRKAAARYDYSLRLMRWMDHYLKGPGGEAPAHPLDYGLDDADE